MDMFDDLGDVGLTLSADDLADFLADVEEELQTDDLPAPSASSATGAWVPTDYENHFFGYPPFISSAERQRWIAERMIDDVGSGDTIQYLDQMVSPDRLRIMLEDVDSAVGAVSIKMRT